MADDALQEVPVSGELESTVVPGVNEDAQAVDVPEASSHSSVSAPPVPEVPLSASAVSVLDGLETVTYVVTDPLTTALVETRTSVSVARLCVRDSLHGPSPVPVLYGLSESTDVGDWGDELSMVVKLASHPPIPHNEVAVPPETVSAVTLPPSERLGMSVVAARPVVWAAEVRHASVMVT